MSADAKTYEGHCFCGAVTIEVTGDPVGAGYCHCKNCRAWEAAPLQAFTLWKAEDVRVTQGEDLIGDYSGNNFTYRQWCKQCGGHLLQRHPEWGLVNVFAPILPTFPFAPEVHVNYESTVLPIKDGLPKLRDFPADLGGSGARGGGVARGPSPGAGAGARRGSASLRAASATTGSSATPRRAASSAGSAI